LLDVPPALLFLSGRFLYLCTEFKVTMAPVWKHGGCSRASHHYHATRCLIWQPYNMLKLAAFVTVLDANDAPGTYSSTTLCASCRPG